MSDFFAVLRLLLRLARCRVGAHPAELRESLEDPLGRGPY